MIEKRVAETKVPYEGGFFIDPPRVSINVIEPEGGGAPIRHEEPMIGWLRICCFREVNTVGKFWRITGPSAARFASI
jgi:hypothetical protein